MAIFRLQIASVGRSAGRRATSSAAYRAGERIRDERSGRTYDHTDRTDVQHKEIVLPSKFSAAEAGWARDRALLWNSAERAEKRNNARVAREYEVALPFELTPQQRLNLTRAFSRDVADRYGVAVDMAIHSPRAGADSRTYHAHLLTTTREITDTGLGAKVGLELTNDERSRRGLLSSSNEFKFLRERWATLTNEALREANIEARVDHRSLAAQGIDREPQPRIPIGMLRRERRGLRDETAERIRETYRQRVEARAARASEAEHANRSSNVRGADLEEIRREAREAWLRFRAADRSASTTPSNGLQPSREPAEKETAANRTQGLDRSAADDDFSL